MLIANTFLGAIALLSTSATALAIPAESDNILEARTASSINLQSACYRSYGPDFKAYTKGKTCEYWICVRNNWALNSSGETYGVDMNKHCRDYWGSHARASCGDGVYTWVCIH